jgi:hypothetical protein
MHSSRLLQNQGFADLAKSALTRRAKQGYDVIVAGDGQASA